MNLCRVRAEVILGASPQLCEDLILELDTTRATAHDFAYALRKLSIYTPIER